MRNHLTYEKIASANKRTTIAKLAPETYFTDVLTHHDRRENPCSFLFDSDRRFTRLWDGSYVDGFFSGEKNSKTEVFVLTREEAIQLAKSTQRLFSTPLRESLRA